jgi:release factor glutamine methyltransferase
MPTAEELLDDAVARMDVAESIDQWPGKNRYDALQLLAHVMGREPGDDEEVGGAEARRFRALVRRRVGGEPAPYIVGRVEFHGLSVEVGRGAFIPRESSEFMADQALRRLRSRRQPLFVDLGTGVGPVALTIASVLPRAEVFGVDLSARPVALARKNARRLGLPNATFLKGDLFAPLPERLPGEVDVITVHPPYVTRREMRTLPDEIRRFEPEESLTDYSSTGMRIVQRVTDEAPSWLRPGGWLLIEVAPDRSRKVATILRHGGFRDVRSTKGPVVVSRVILGRT